MEGYTYIVIFVDDCTRVTFLYLMKSKSEVSTILQDFHTLVSNQFHSTIKTLRSDNGIEFLSNTMVQYLSSK